MADKEISLDEVKEQIAGIVRYIDALNEKVDNLDRMIFDEVLNPMNEYYTQYKHDSDLNDWKDKYWDKLEPYGDRLRAIEGEDFDVYDQSMTDYQSLPEEGRMDSDSYIDQLTQMLDEQLNKIREALGVSPETPITIEDNGPNEEPIINVEEEVAPEETVSEETVAEETVAEPGNEQVQAEDEVAAYEKELEAYLPKKK